MHGGEKGQGASQKQDIDLNITPIIDCFTVLICYLMISASFLSFAALETQIAANGSTSTKEQPPPKKSPSLSIQMLRNSTINIYIRGGSQKLDLTETIPAKETFVSDVKGLVQKLELFKKEYKNFSNVTLSADSTVTYKDMVDVISSAKPIFPKLSVSGEKIVFLSTK